MVLDLGMPIDQLDWAIGTDGGFAFRQSEESVIYRLRRLDSPAYRLVECVALWSQLLAS